MFIKFRSVAALAFSALAITFYSACTKETKVTTNNDTEIATAIAVNLYKSFGNTITSQNNVTGLPAGNSVVNGKKINELTCGQVIDQPFDNTYTKGDSIKDVMTGANKFVISCDDKNQPNGYLYTGNYVNTGFNTVNTYTYTVKENYILKALVDKYAKMQVDGTQISTVKTQSKKNANELMIQNNSYVLKGMVIDATTKPFDLAAGTADFVSNGTNDGREFSFSGTIQYLGNHKAKVSFDGKVIDIEIR
ncbi:hypothetical protein ACFQZX_12485 [Mucilaginibacter litoreus]|uniref:Lipoprotein n=1 Tax=Mucilaginibacter litoreus TaxID=1048221 RepID=A0ABW3AVF0_9SPHI